MEAEEQAPVEQETSQQEPQQRPEQQQEQQQKQQQEDQSDPTVVDTRKMCADMFGKVSDYVNGELAATSAEYELLLRLNQITTAKYTDMSKLAGSLTDLAERLNDKFVSLQQYCDQIDQVEASVTELEQTAYRLDTYAKQLEAKFKALEKR